MFFYFSITLRNLFLHSFSWSHSPKCNNLSNERVHSAGRTVWRHQRTATENLRWEVLLQKGDPNPRQAGQNWSYIMLPRASCSPAVKLFKGGDDSLSNPHYKNLTLLLWWFFHVLSEFPMLQLMAFALGLCCPWEDYQENFFCSTKVQKAKRRRLRCMRDTPIH